ncbi:MAG: hypothetical protein ABIG61_14695, partial [Planctomycetota bacterium]
MPRSIIDTPLRTSSNDEPSIRIDIHDKNFEIAWKKMRDLRYDIDNYQPQAIVDKLPQLGGDIDVNEWKIKSRTAKNIEIEPGTGGILDINGNTDISGTLTLQTIAKATTDPGKYLVDDSSVVKYLTSVELATGLLHNDIGGLNIGDYRHLSETNHDRLINYKDATTLHWHSKVLSSDGSQDPALSAKASGSIILARIDNAAIDTDKFLVSNSGTIEYRTGTQLASDIDHALISNLNSATYTHLTAANAATLTDDSMADALHRHSELSASDGDPDKTVSVDATGNVTISVIANAAVDTDKFLVSNSSVLEYRTGAEVADDIEGDIVHNNLSGLQGGIAAEYYHFTSAQHTEIAAFWAATNISGAEAETLTDGSIADSLHEHSKLVASDGDPDPALSADTTGEITLSTINNAGVDTDTFLVSNGGTIQYRDSAGLADDIQGDIDHATLANLNSATYTHLSSANAATLTDGSIADSLHEHAKLVASDGDPDPALDADADGVLRVNSTEGISKSTTIEGAITGLLIQSQTTDAYTALAIAPNGTSTNTAYRMFMTSDYETNYEQLALAVDTGNSAFCI